MKLLSFTLFAALFSRAQANVVEQAFTTGQKVIIGTVTTLAGTAITVFIQQLAAEEKAFEFLLPDKEKDARKSDPMHVEPMVVNDYQAGYCKDEEDKWKSMGRCVHFVNMPCLPEPEGCSYELCCQTPHH